VPHGSEHYSGGMFREFEDKPVTLGLINMYGCTSVLIISRRAVWWAHYYEDLYSARKLDDNHVMDTYFHPDVTNLSASRISFVSLVSYKR
jgi:hypothetical protein